MAELARNYFDNLQLQDLAQFDNQQQHDWKLNEVLSEIPAQQQLHEPHLTELNWPVTRAQVENAIYRGKNGSATGLDGCPYELWKELKIRHDALAGKPDARTFDIAHAFTTVFQDIQAHGVDQETDFTLGWMCPVFKKKDPTIISNYRPITLMNTDYKLLTKVLALQLSDYARNLIHSDQAGFIPKRSIFDHIRLVKAVINYADITEENGAIVALDQEKAYDKIRHDYLWKTLEAFHLPQPFIRTMKALYSHAYTKVAVNGVFSTPFQITRGVRQGDPLSCLIFDIAIEPLACKFRNDQSLKGLSLPGLGEKLIAKFFADDTALYLSHEDRFDDVQKLLTKWCEVSGAKFNIEKTEIIPLGSEQHRHMIPHLRKINVRDTATLDERVKIAVDGEAVRSLGAWIGNKTNDTDPWEPILDNVSKALNRWKKTHPSMAGRKIIVQTVVGGHTQFLTKAQGMPALIEKAFTKIIRDFMWEEDSSPRIALDALQRPIEEGGLNLLNLEARNEAIELMWLKSYLNFSPSRPTWAKVTDLIIVTAAPTNALHQPRKNPFLQAWKMAMKGKKAALLSNDIIRMTKAARKYHANLAAIRLTPALRTQLPAWYHVASKPRPMTNRPSKCLLQRHSVNIVADLMRMSARLRNEPQNSPHTPTHNCNCCDCSQDRQSGCRDPHACATEALHRLHAIYPKLNPLLLGDPHDNLSLTRNRKARNELA
jgi:hypothetical protein